MTTQRPPGPLFDTIVAMATPAGRGAVGVIRLSGADVPGIAMALLGTLPAPRVARLMLFRDSDGVALDQGLVVYFPAPASFTGEHVLELQGHGGAKVMDMIIERLLALGCRMARPGEFSERAFLNGKMDVAQAEAVADLIDAGTSAAARAAVRSMQGDFSARIHSLQRHLTELRVHVEGAIDFPDEEVDLLNEPALNARLARVFEEFDSIQSAARHGAVLRAGLSVVIAGRPNAGKSSLLNRLVGDEVAIVTSLPGTTRDLLRQHVELDGVPVNLVDTAGLRVAVDVVEEEGIRRAKLEMQAADRLLFVVDASLPAPSPPLELRSLPDVPVTLVLNKIDLTGEEPRIEESGGVTRIYVSAQTGAGVHLIREHLKRGAGLLDVGGGALSARRRHLDALERAKQQVTLAAKILTETRASELFAEHLRLAQRALGEITGEFTSDDLLGEIFGSFCIGK